MIQYVFLGLTMASAIYTAYFQSYVGLVMFLVSVVSLLYKDTRKPQTTNHEDQSNIVLHLLDHDEKLKKLETDVLGLNNLPTPIVDLQKRTEKLEDSMSKLNLGAAYKK